MKNMKPVLEFIISELMNPFQKHRRNFSEWNIESLFFKMTELSPFRCKVGSIVFCVITKLAPNFMSVRLESGIETTIYSNEVSEKDANIDLTREFYEV